MKKIELTNGGFTIVNDEDYGELSKLHWRRNSSGYAKSKTGLMHRIVAKTPSHLFTDHINRNKLDNRRENLRWCTASENRFNTPLRKDNTSGYRGVIWNRFVKKWVAQIRQGKKRIYLGAFDKKEDAIHAYDTKAILQSNSFFTPNNQTNQLGLN